MDLAGRLACSTGPGAAGGRSGAGVVTGRRAGPGSGQRAARPVTGFGAMPKAPPLGGVRSILLCVVPSATSMAGGIFFAWA